MQVGDWLQRWCGKNSPSSPESLLHMNFYAWYFVLNVHCVPPRGTLKTIWQQFAAYNANIHIKASVHKYAHVLTHAKTHTRILITHFLLFPLSLLIRSCILLCLIIFSEYKTAATYLKRKGGWGWVWTSTSASIIVHQPSEEQLLHQQALTDTEYLMLRLLKNQRHFWSDLLWQCDVLRGKEGGADAPCCALWETRQWGEKKEA